MTTTYIVNKYLIIGQTGLIYELSGCEFEVEFESRFNQRETLKSKIHSECIGSET